jgi:hypothetical protein
MRLLFLRAYHERITRVPASRTDGKGVLNRISAPIREKTEEAAKEGENEQALVEKALVRSQVMMHIHRIFFIIN